MLLDFTGGAEGDRTPDLRIANAALCQTELLPHAEQDTTFQVCHKRVLRYRPPANLWRLHETPALAERRLLLWSNYSFHQRRSSIPRVIVELGRALRRLG